MTSTESRNTRLPIADKRLLAQAVAALERLYGSQETAAAELGIQQGHFSKLRRGAAGDAITRHLFNRIGELLERAGLKRDYKRLVDAVFSPDTLPRRRAWWAWHRKAWRQVQPGYPFSDINRSAWYELRRELPDLEVEAHIKSFVERWEGHGHHSQRVWLAVASALAPLLASQNSGGMERSWRELHAAGELEIYLKAALKAQDVLLRRESNILKRAQQVAARTE